MVRVFSRSLFFCLSFSVLCPSVLFAADRSEVILQDGTKLNQEPQGVVPLSDLIARLRSADGMRPRASQIPVENISRSPVYPSSSGVQAAPVEGVSRSPLAPVSFNISGGSGVHLGNVVVSNSLPAQKSVPSVSGRVALPPASSENSGGSQFLTGRRGGGCEDRGVGTVIDPSCLSHLAPVPSVISQKVGGVPLPDMGAGQGYVSSESVSAALSAEGSSSVPMSSYQGGASDSSRQPQIGAQRILQSISSDIPAGGVSRDTRISCSVSDSSGVVTNMRVADARACIVAGTGLLSASNGRFSITMVDSFGGVAAVFCRSFGEAARPVCSMSR